jgi:hypothetical protein
MYNGRFEKSEKRRRERARMGSEQVHNDLYHMFKQTDRWTLFGKHYGTPINELSLSYLEWVMGNLQGKHKEIAEKEFYRRKNS